MNYPDFYFDLFRVTLPETALEVAALLVLIVDLGFLRKAALNVRLAVAAALGVAGCGAALWAIGIQTGQQALVDGKIVVLHQRRHRAAAQCGILVLTALTLLLLFDSAFTKHVGEFVAVVLMAAAGGLLIAAAQDLLVIFIGLELLSLGLYILTAFAKSSGKSAEAAMKYYLFGGMSAAFLLFGFSYLYGLSGSTNLYWIQGQLSPHPAQPAALCRLDFDCRRARFQNRSRPVPSLGAGHLRRRTRSRRGLHCVGLQGCQLCAAISPSAGCFLLPAVPSVDFSHAA
jgi:NADH:ubiquinone oxidoreductase subunit 2 (subunit N)